MKISIGNFKAARDSALAVMVFEGEEKEALARVEKENGVKAAVEFKAKNSAQVVSAGEKNIILVGLGKRNDFTMETLRRAVARSISAVLSLKTIKLAVDVSAVKENATATASTVTEAAIIASYSFVKYKSQEEKKERKEIQEFTLFGFANAKEVERGITEGTVLGNAVNYVREMANEPANVATPTALASWARETAAKCKNVSVKVFEKKDLEKMGCNALLSVARGSVEPPVMVIMEYKPSKYAKTLALIGKGITFDSGGISLKPGKDMDQMKFDKCGACAVVGAVKAASELQLSTRVIGVFAATENMPSGSASKPGDIVRAYNGKSIEILNTDAEGRLILADALSYTVKELKPDYVVDIATLTGACVVALGNACSGLMGNDSQLVKMVKECGEESGDRAWELPLWPDYEEKVKSDVAEVKNLGAPDGGAGTITAAAFLKAFVGNSKWAHLDVAGTAWANSPSGYYNKGATGVGVRLFARLAKKLERSVT